ncbi:hypothetical protein ODZ84_15575 [Chryseobacterium fluminis]|uniref:hypothetical protein n=1 Tax=Chryseobacterium fluminis TaxID=2983606 RepID=UPI0022553707|nr:hypothetical protein [Chryseobacterium sp. MMS21-Ot14]UZT96635.1 hypothetical protein ODZ84_15575 [Chryseobacterium sp. MMS21-Ot14]
MKKAIKILGMLMLAFFAVTSITACSDDDDPANNDFFAGTYKGNISYVDSDKNISTNGSVFVTKIASGTKYNFAFSDGIPDLNGVEFQQQGDNTLVMVGSTATSYIRIDNNDLKILYIKDGRTWTANCTR